MIKVIEYGKRQVKCDYCNSVLEYTQEDITTSQTGMNEFTKEIVCPVCGNGIKVQ